MLVMLTETSLKGYRINPNLRADEKVNHHSTMIHIN